MHKMDAITCGKKNQERKTDPLLFSDQTTTDQTTTDQTTTDQTTTDQTTTDQTTTDQTTTGKASEYELVLLKVIQQLGINRKTFFLVLICTLANFCVLKKNFLFIGIDNDN